MNKKIIWGIIIVAILGAGWFIYRDKINNSITDWKTYTSPEYGYEIKYPADWTLRENAGRMRIVSSKYPGKPDTADEYEYVEVSSREYQCIPHDWGRIADPAGDMTTDSYKTSCVSGDKNLHISLFAMEDSSKNIEDKILSTFKISSPSGQTVVKGSTGPDYQPNGPLGWKVYTNDEYGISFYYPKNFSLNESVLKTGYYDYELTRLAEVSNKETYIDRATFSLYADPFSEEKCYTASYGQDAHIAAKTKTIGGNTYRVFIDHVADSAMGGQRGINTQYRIFLNNTCYVLDYLVAWHEVGYAGVVNTGKNSATAEQIKSQSDVVSANLTDMDQIISSFTFLDSEAPRTISGNVNFSSNSKLIEIRSPQPGEQLRSGSTYKIQWTAPQLPADKQGFIVLMKGDKVIQPVNTSIALNGGKLSDYGGSYPWTIPNNLASGSDYRFRFGIGSYYDPDNIYAAVYSDSGTFTITN